METSKSREEAERWITVAGRLLESQDLVASKRFITKAQETDSTVEGIDQITAIIDVLLAAEKRINNHLDWYAILQLDRRSNDLELIKRQYRKLALLLHPDKNKFCLSDNAFKFVSDAWAFLSDSNKKSLYDNEFSICIKYDPIVLKKHPSPSTGKRKAENPAPVQSRLSTFWTLCPYCYHLYEYPRVYEDCCLRCQKCRRCFHAVDIPSPPPPVCQGKEMYHCCWAVFPIGFTTPDNQERKSMFPENEVEIESENNGCGNKFQRENVNVPDESVRANNVEPRKTVITKTTARKSIPSRPFSKPVVEAWDKINRGESDSDLDVNVNVPNKGVQLGSAANIVEPQKTLITKVTARKSIPMRPFHNPIVEALDTINGGKQNTHAPNKGVQVGSGANNVELLKTVTIKTPARKSIPPRPNSKQVVEVPDDIDGGDRPPGPNNKPVVEVPDGIDGGKGDSDWVRMDSIVNGPNKNVQIGAGSNNVEPQKTLRTKTTARKSTIKPKPHNKPVLGASHEINVGQPYSDGVGTDLNMEVKLDAQEPNMADLVEELVIESLDTEATEGIGFFEGLDDILENLPMLAVPGEQRTQNSC